MTEEVTEQTDTVDDAGVVADLAAEGSTEAPEWLLADKYMTGDRTVEEATLEQAKAYSELQSKFGGFTGAPESYDVKLSDSLIEAGGELDMEDGLLVEAMKFAKDANMSNESFNQLAELFVMNEIATAKAMEQQAIEEMKALGPNADARISNINAWANKNMSPENVAGLQDVATTAEGVKAIERLISLTRNAPVSVDEAQPAEVVSADELRELQFARNEHGQMKMSADPEYRKMVEKMFRDKYGSGDFQTVVG